MFRRNVTEMFFKDLGNSPEHLENIYLKYFNVSYFCLLKDVNYMPV